MEDLAIIAELSVPYEDGFLYVFHIWSNGRVDCAILPKTQAGQYLSLLHAIDQRVAEDPDADANPDDPVYESSNRLDLLLEEWSFEFELDEPMGEMIRKHVQDLTEFAEANAASGGTLEKPSCLSFRSMSIKRALVQMVRDFREHPRKPLF